MKRTAPKRGARIAAANRDKKRTPEQIERIKEAAFTARRYLPHTFPVAPPLAPGRKGALLPRTGKVRH
jgi:hypothetical protein